MKKLLSLVIVLSYLSILVGCSAKPSMDNEIRIGVLPDPHSKLVTLVIDDLEKEGIKVTLIEFNDYVKPNHALNDGKIDANFFQHKQYLDDFSTKEGLDLVSIGNVHIEPMALYAPVAKSLDDIMDGAEIAIPSDSVNTGRALLLLESNGLIKLKSGTGLEATKKDIVENPKNIKITLLEAAILPKILNEVDGAIINGNYALEAGLNPVKDGLIIEGKNSPYANIVVVKAGKETEEKFIKLIKALQSDEVRKFIEVNYGGGVVPAF